MAERRKKCSKTRIASLGPWCAELRCGDRMSRAEFHRIYEQMPRNFRAELIGGIVFVSSPLKQADGIYRMRSFPGLSIHSQALFAHDYHVLMKTLEGLATPEHQAFVEKLASQHRPAKKRRSSRKKS